MGPYEYVKYLKNIAYALDNYNPGGYVREFEKQWVDPELYRNVKGTSWQDEIFRMAGIQKVSASISGGNKISRLYYSSEYLDQEGTLLNSEFKKLSNNLKS